MVTVHRACAHRRVNTPRNSIVAFCVLLRCLFSVQHRSFYAREAALRIDLCCVLKRRGQRAAYGESSCSCIVDCECDDAVVCTRGD